MRFETSNAKLADVCEIRYGKDHKHLNDGNIPAYGSGGLMRMVDKSIHDKKSVLIPRKGTLNNLFLVDPPFWTVDTLFWTDIDTDRVTPEFLYYQLKTMDLASKNVGTAVPSLTTALLNELPIFLPELKVQQQITSPLIAIDKKISINSQINNNLLQQCATLYDEICSTAEIALMSDLVAVVETGSRPKGGAQTSGIPSIGAEKIERFGTYDYSGEKFISEEYFAKLKRGIISSGDVLLYKDGAYTGKSSMALDGFPHVKCAVNEHVFIIRTLNKKHQYFLYFTLQNDDVHKMIYGLACGKAAQPGLNQPELLSVSIKLPPEDVLEAFEEQVNPLMHQIALNTLETKRLSDLRDAILPKLMSGEIDVSSIELD